MRGTTPAAALAALVGLAALAPAGCGQGMDGGQNTFNGYRTGARCSAAGTCPPGQKCDPAHICRQPCTRPGGRCMGGQPCECPNGNCDYDGLCRPMCGSIGGGGGSTMCGGMSGPNCADGEFCDQDLNICRPICIGGACSAGLTCTTVATGCQLCRPTGAPGGDGGAGDGGGGPDGGGSCTGVTGGPACGSGDACPSCLTCSKGEGVCLRPCATPGPCTGSPCECNQNGAAGRIEICDVDHFCRPACGTGMPGVCGARPNCDYGLTCDTSTGICRQDCRVGCPAGFTCKAAATDSCMLCRPN